MLLLLSLMRKESTGWTWVLFCHENLLQILPKYETDTTPLTRPDIVTVQNSELNVKYTLELTVYMSLQNNNIFLLLFFLA